MQAAPCKRGGLCSGKLWRCMQSPPRLHGAARIRCLLSGPSALPEESSVPFIYHNSSLRLIGASGFFVVVFVVLVFFDFPMVLWGAQLCKVYITGVDGSKRHGQGPRSIFLLRQFFHNFNFVAHSFSGVPPKGGPMRKGAPTREALWVKAHKRNPKGKLG